MIEFQYIWAFLLLPVPLILRLFLPEHREPRAAVGVPFMVRLSDITGRKPAPGAATIMESKIQQAFLLLAWILVVTAMARPQWIENPITKQVPTRDLLLAVDLSGSMETEDFKDASGKSVNRLTAVKQVLDEFLARRKGDRVGLIFFGSAAFVQAPFTDDLNVVRAEAAAAYDKSQKTDEKHQIYAERFSRRFDAAQSFIILILPEMLV